MAKISSTKLDVVWSPVHDNKFVLWGSSDITLYEVARLEEIGKETSFAKISPTRGASVVASQSSSGVRCLDLSALPGQPDPLLALGHTSGNISFTTLKRTQDSSGLLGREFVPRYTRFCNSVSWSHTEPRLLASGMEKHRSEHAILVWDVSRVPAPPPGEELHGPSLASPPVGAEKPLAEMALSEAAHSVSWTNLSDRTLVASTNMKFIKIYDLRDLSNKAVSTVQTAHCYGACAAPLSPWLLASRGERAVCVWDARRLARPLRLLEQPRAVAKIQWCPTRRNLLMSLQRDCGALRLLELQRGSEAAAADIRAPHSPSALEAEECPDVSVLERDVSPSADPSALVCCAWHPTREGQLLAVCQSGAISEHTVCERVTLAWGARAGLAWTAGAELRLMPPAFYEAVGDGACTVRRRALCDYGLKQDLWQNADLAEDEVLHALWHFLALSKSLVEDGCIRNSPWRHPGVLSVLRPPGEGYRSEIVPSLLPDLPNRRVTVYRSSERSRALQLCGWGWGWENACAGVERLEAAGTPCRAAAVAAFHLRLRTALDVLLRAKEPQLRVVALALAGLSEERLWREAAAALCTATPALPDAYLRALLHFLSAAVSAAGAAPPAHPDLQAVLNETEMRLEDRVAFACIFLPDAALFEYARRTADALVARGDLSAMLLTGASPEGITLLQRWVDHTGDVQTAALVAARCFTPELLAEPRAQHWLDSYRSILDSWQLWWARCMLNTFAGAGAGAGAGARRAGVACTYCGKGVAAPPGAARPRPAFARLPPPAAKMKQISACPNCRKPLPRCGVCSLHLGTDASGAGAGAGAGAAHGAWFSWCATCRHGGHAHHMALWFREHAECPVSSCSCRCDLLDAPEPARAPAAAAPGARA